MSTLTLTYTAAANTVAPSASYNLNNTEIVNWSTTIDHSNTTGSTGFWASDLKPPTAGAAQFGATATSVGYKFLANDATATPLTVSGVSGQTADLFDVTLTSGGTKGFFINGLGQPNANAVIFGAGAGEPAGTNVWSGNDSSTNSYLVNVPSGSTYGFRWFVNNASSIMQLTSGGVLGVSGQIIGSSSVSSVITAGTGSFAFGSGGTGAQLYFDGANYNFYNVGSLASKANIVANTGVYTTTSDQRLKENFAPIAQGLETILKLRPGTFDWIIDKSRGAGFLAQDVQQIIPDAVPIVDKESGMLGVTDSHITPYVVAAIQELAIAFQTYRTAHP